MKFYRLLVAISVLAFTTPTFACVKIFPKLKVKGASFEKHFFSLEDSAEGPVFNENGEDKMIYNSELKKWCLGKDCEVLNKEGTGTSKGAKFNIPLRDGPNGPIIGLIVHGSRPGQMLIFSVKAGAKIEPGQDAMEIIDRSKPWVSLDPNPNDLNSLDLNVMTRDGKVGKATHKNQKNLTRSVGDSSKPDDKFTDIVGKDMGQREGCGYPPIDTFQKSGSGSGGSGGGSGGK